MNPEAPTATAPGIERAGPALVSRSNSVGSARTDAWSVRRGLMLVLLYSIPVIMALQPVVDPDVFWHVKVGEWIVEHRAVPWTDSFSEYGAGRPWIAYNWLFEVIFHAAYEALGLYGIVLYRLVLGLGLAAVMHAFVSRGGAPFLPGVLLTAVGLSALGPLVLPRSFLISILCFLAVVHVVMVCRESGATRPLLVLPLLFVVWANMHIQYVYGLFVLGLAALEPLIHRVARVNLLGPPATALPFRAAVLTLLACGVASTLTPYHVHLHISVVEVVGQTWIYQYLNELRPLAFRSAWDWLVLGLALAAAFALGWRRQLQPFPVLLLVFGVLVSFRSIRDVWVVIIAAVTILSSGIATAPAHSVRRPAAWRGMGLVAVGIVAIGAIVVLARGLTPARLEAAVADRYPVGAAAFVERQGYRGPLFNEYGWGGYLIWRLPGIPVSMDGRANLHGDERIKRTAATWQGLPEWQADPELGAANLVIGPRTAPLASLLRLDDRFELAYEDDVAVVFTARTSRPQPTAR